VILWVNVMVSPCFPLPRLALSRNLKSGWLRSRSLQPTCHSTIGQVSSNLRPFALAAGRVDATGPRQDCQGSIAEPRMGTFQTLMYASVESVNPQDSERYSQISGVMRSKTGLVVNAECGSNRTTVFDLPATHLPHIDGGLGRIGHAGADVESHVGRLVVA
jgi:hypothetical protein